MPIYRIAVDWSVSGELMVEANSLAEAIEKADDAPLPVAADYIDGSFEINRPMLAYLNEKVLTDEELDDLGHEVV